MANKYHNFCISFFLSLVLVKCVVDVKASHDDWNDGDYDYDNDNTKHKWLSPWDVQDLPPEPRKDFYRDLRSCLKTLTRRCNKRLYNYVFSRQEIHKPCCRKVYQMEMGCIESLAWVLTKANPWYNARQVDQRLADVLRKCSQILANDKEFWNQTSNDAGQW